MERVCYLRCGRSTKELHSSDRSVNFVSSWGIGTRDSTSSGTLGWSEVLPGSLWLKVLQEKKHILWQMGRNKGRKINIFQGNWPCCLSSEEQRVGFKSHGAICGGRGFGKDQADQHIEARVVGARITAVEQARDEAQQGGKEELEEMEEEDHKITGTQMCKEQQTNSSNSPVQTLSWWTSPSWIPGSDLVLTCCWKSCGTKKFRFTSFTCIKPLKHT